MDVPTYDFTVHSRATETMRFGETDASSCSDRSGGFRGRAVVRNPSKRLGDVHTMKPATMKPAGHVLSPPHMRENQASAIAVVRALPHP